MPPGLVETQVDVILGLAALSLIGLVAIVALLWAVPLLLVASLTDSLGD